jgi:hypothetical protein
MANQQEPAEQAGIEKPGACFGTPKQRSCRARAVVSRMLDLELQQCLKTAKHSRERMNKHSDETWELLRNLPPNYLSEEEGKAFGDSLKQYFAECERIRKEVLSSPSQSTEPNFADLDLEGALIEYQRFLHELTDQFEQLDALTEDFIRGVQPSDARLGRLCDYIRQIFENQKELIVVQRRFLTEIAIGVRDLTESSGS